MKDLIKRVCEATGLDESAALPAIGHVLQFMRDHAPESNVAELVDKIPDAQQAIKAAAATSDAGVTAAIGTSIDQCGSKVILRRKNMRRLTFARNAAATARCNSDITRRARNRRTSARYMQKSFPCGRCSRVVSIAGSEQRCEDVGTSGENPRWAELGAICKCMRQEPDLLTVSWARSMHGARKTWYDPIDIPQGAEECKPTPSGDARYVVRRTSLRSQRMRCVKAASRQREFFTNTSITRRPRNAPPLTWPTSAASERVRWTSVDFSGQCRELTAAAMDAAARSHLDELLSLFRML